MIKLFPPVFLLYLLASMPTYAAATADIKAGELQTVSKVDLNKYLGKWHEIARIDHRFQKGCYDSTATYSWRDDGDVKVVNSCSIAGKEKRKSATGRAWVKDKETNAKLRVQFVLTGIKLGFLSGNYWILDLADDYSHVLVGDPSRDYLWILARSPKLSAEKLEGLLLKAAALGYETDRILLNTDLRP